MTYPVIVALLLLSTTTYAEDEGSWVPTGENWRQTPLENYVLFSEFEISKEDLLDTRRHLNQVRREVGRDFGFYPEDKISVILSRKETFQDYSGMPSHVGGFFDGRIHLPLPSEAESASQLQSILWHEYTHAVILMLSSGKCPVWLNEGFAVWEQNQAVPYTLIHLAKHFETSDKLPYTPPEMETTIQDLRTRDPFKTVLVYEQAFVFVDYLFSRFSAKNAKDFLARMGEGASFEDAARDVLHLTPADIGERWLSHAKKLLNT